MFIFLAMMVAPVHANSTSFIIPYDPNGVRGLCKCCRRTRAAFDCRAVDAAEH